MRTDPRYAGYLEGLAAGLLMMPACATCEERYLPARERCGTCGSAAIRWIASDGTGRIWSKVEFHKQYLPDRPVPYTVVLVELSDGGRVYALTPHSYDELAVGAPVEFRPERSVRDAPVFVLRRS